MLYRTKIRRYIKKGALILCGTIFIFCIGMAIIASLKQPSHDRQWWEALSVLPYADINGDLITIHNIRDWSYDTTGPVSKEWVTKTYDMRSLSGAWFFVVPFAEWDGLAHTMISFDFIDQEPLILSIEARKEVGEEYQLVRGLLNEFEIIYLWGTERDFVGRRIITQGDPVYMYPLDINVSFAGQFLHDLLQETNSLYNTPAFYNTIGNNCTNKLAISANRVTPDTVPLNIARILPGYSFDLLYRLGYIKDFGEKEILREKYYVSDKINGATPQQEFSKLLRGI